MKIELRNLLASGSFVLAVMTLATFDARPAQAAAPGSALTEESLGKLLNGLGLKPKKQLERYDFEFKALYAGDEWELSMSAVLSQNGQSIWVMAWLDELPRAAGEVPRTALLRLLAENDRMGRGKFFAYVPKNRRFVLQKVVPNQGISTSEFRKILQDVGGSVVETYPQWSVARWSGNKPKSNSATRQPRTAGRPKRRQTSSTRPEKKQTVRQTSFELPVRK